jgi:hypothetical protein
MMTRTRRGIADDDGSDGEVPQFKISRLNQRHIWPAKPCDQCMALLRCMSPLWHEANISRCLLSGFGGKADISQRLFPWSLALPTNFSTLAISGRHANSCHPPSGPRPLPSWSIACAAKRPAGVIGVGARAQMFGADTQVLGRRPSG